MVDRPALSRAFFLLAQVFDKGFTPDVRSRLEEAGNPIPSLIGVSRSREDEVSRHERVLGYAVLPYAGVFLNIDARIGGETESALVRAIQDAGLPLKHDGLAPEHVASEARLLSQLVQASSCDGITSQLISDHLLSWLPSFAHALRENDAADYADGADLLVELCLTILDAVPTDSVQVVLAPAVVPTEDPRSGIRQISEHLAAHARSGIYLGRSGIGQIARQAEAPRGFGGSVLMLGNLFRSAAHFESLPAVTGSLVEIAASYRAMWQDCASRHQAFEAWSQAWITRIDATVSMLSEVCEAIDFDSDEASDSGGGIASEGI
ncbi:molecular chaperone TorD family protein [Rhodothermus sp. AH-315-K08]|nr:molecular chaperone TorD family protein [Rhodothermus sp. AH-315-K08]